MPQHPPGGVMTPASPITSTSTRLKGTMTNHQDSASAPADYIDEAGFFHQSDEAFLQELFELESPFSHTTS